MKPILTPREAQLARMLGDGMAPRSIAAALGIAPRTVRQQLYNVQEKAGAANLVNLAVMVATGELDLG